MALTNRDRVGAGLDLLGEGLRPFFEREMRSAHGDRWLQVAALSLDDGRGRPAAQDSTHDVYALLRVMWDQWARVFGRVLGRAERTLVSELRDTRNRWAHQEPFSSDDAYRALDSVQRLLAAVSADQAAEVDRMKHDLLRVRFTEQARTVTRRTANVSVEGEPSAGLRPWREIATPHDDVASGRYQQAEFAADLGQVFRGDAQSEYQDPREFFGRTFITGGLRDLLVQAVERLAGSGGNPVVALQTNFGGGKTHSLLALYHLFSGTPPAQLPGAEEIVQAAGAASLPEVRRAVLVGTAIAPSHVYARGGGIEVHTLWGEMAWQLAGSAGYGLVAEADRTGTNPGDRLLELFRMASPCLILIDEWVAYARQLSTDPPLPAGSFDAHFTFAQALTEAAKATPGVLLVVSMPASDMEIGGAAGREALRRLENVVRRADSPWRPASAEEGFEIVRRRLFKSDATGGRERDAVVRKFAELYRTQRQEFPREVAEAEYERRMAAAYPIHPELFDRLYDDWSSLEEFQRTRGVLRLMAAVIHALWERQDASLLIMPGTVPVDDDTVSFELRRYLSEGWAPVIERDVDGPSSLPLSVDRENPNLGRYSAARRVARTLFIGTAPTAGTPNRGLDDRRVKLGCVQPGESPAVFGDALRRLTERATNLYSDGSRSWLDLQPTVAKLARDRAGQLEGSDLVQAEIVRRIQAQRERGDFTRVHPVPRSPADVPDEAEARLVILSPEVPHAGKAADGEAIRAASEILDGRGASPRRYRNMLVFLAADRNRVADLQQAARDYLAWKSIVEDKDTLNLDQVNLRQADSQFRHADETVTQRIPETYTWILVPSQGAGGREIGWEELRVGGQEPLAVRASRKLRVEEQLITEFGGTRLRLVLDSVPLWRGDHVALRDLWDYFAQYLYLPRLRDSSVLAAAVRSGVASFAWEADTFAYAEDYDEPAKRYLGLVAGQQADVIVDRQSLVVRPEAARHQLDAQRVPMPGGAGEEAGSKGEGEGGDGGRSTGGEAIAQPAIRRFHGSVEVDPLRLTRDAGQIAEEILQHLVGLLGAEVRVTLEIEADLGDGAPDNVVRTVTENARTLKFKTFGFEKE